GVYLRVSSGMGYLLRGVGKPEEASMKKTRAGAAFWNMRTRRKLEAAQAGFRTFVGASAEARVENGPNFARNCAPPEPANGSGCAQSSPEPRPRQSPSRKKHSVSYHCGNPWALVLRFPSQWEWPAALQCGIPLAGAGAVHAFHKLEDRIRRGFLSAHVVIIQQILTHFLAVEGRLRLHRRCFEPIRLRSSVGVKSGLSIAAVSRPEPKADDLLRIRLARNCIGSGPLRSRTPGEPRHRQIKAAPEKMHRARVAQPSGLELPKHSIRLQKYAPEAMRGVGIIRGMDGVLRKGNRVRHLIRT